MQLQFTESVLFFFVPDLQIIKSSRIIKLTFKMKRGSILIRKYINIIELVKVLLKD